MSNQNLFKTAQLTLADLDLHLIKNLPHLFLRDPEILSNFKAHGAGKFSILCFFLNNLS